MAMSDPTEDELPNHGNVNYGVVQIDIQWMGLVIDLDVSRAFEQDDPTQAVIIQIIRSKNPSFRYNVPSFIDFLSS